MVKDALRAMALYNWPEDFNFSDNRDFLIELVEDAKINPFKLEVEIGKDKRKMATVRKNKTAAQIIREAPPFNGFEFCRPIDGNFLNLESDMVLSVASYGKMYLVAHAPDKLSVSDLLRHVTLICRHLTPQYGLSHVMAPSAAVFFLHGAGSMSMSQENSRRASEVCYYSIGHLIGKPFDRLIDIYEFNVLNARHLEREVFGQTLASWIRKGSLFHAKGRGGLVEINDKVAVWIVPDDFRRSVRSKFFNAGLLEVPV